MFQGFPQSVIDFMWGIRFNNEKGWFEAHKQEYLDTFQRPMRALGEEVFARFLDRYPDLDLMLRVSRIYRDARRLHGRGPYKDRLWLSMERPKEDWIAQPVYWFELEPEGYSYGLGYWAAPPVAMAKLRARLDRDPKPFEALVRSFNRQDVFSLQGEDYKRPKGAAPSRLLAPWYNKRSFVLSCDRPHDDLLWSHQLADALVEGFSLLVPMYRYFLLLEGDPDPRL